MPYLHRLVAATVCASACFWSLSAVAEGTEFKHPLDGAPIVFALKPGEMETPALKEFKATGRNAYRGDPAAITQGRSYTRRGAKLVTTAMGRAGSVRR